MYLVSLPKVVDIVFQFDTNEKLDFGPPFVRFFDGRSHGRGNPKSMRHGQAKRSDPVLLWRGKRGLHSDPRN